MIISVDQNPALDLVEQGGQRTLVQRIFWLSVDLMGGITRSALIDGLSQKFHRAVAEYRLRCSALQPQAPVLAGKRSYFFSRTCDHRGQF